MTRHDFAIHPLILWPDRIIPLDRAVVPPETSDAMPTSAQVISPQGIIAAETIEATDERPVWFDLSDLMRSIDLQTGNPRSSSQGQYPTASGNGTLTLQQRARSLDPTRPDSDNTDIPRLSEPHHAVIYLVDQRTGQWRRFHCVRIQYDSRQPPPEPDGPVRFTLTGLLNAWMRTPAVLPIGAPQAPDATNFDSPLAAWAPYGFQDDDTHQPTQRAIYSGAPGSALTAAQTTLDAAIFEEPDGSLHMHNFETQSQLLAQTPTEPITPDTLRWDRLASRFTRDLASVRNHTIADYLPATAPEEITLADETAALSVEDLPHIVTLSAADERELIIHRVQVTVSDPRNSAASRLTYPMPGSFQQTPITLPPFRVAIPGGPQGTITLYLLLYRSRDHFVLEIGLHSAELNPEPAPNQDIVRVAVTAPGNTARIAAGTTTYTVGSTTYIVTRTPIYRWDINPARRAWNVGFEAWVAANPGVPVSQYPGNPPPPITPLVRIFSHYEETRTPVTTYQTVTQTNYQTVLVDADALAYQTLDQQSAVIQIPDSVSRHGRKSAPSLPVLPLAPFTLTIAGNREQVTPSTPLSLPFLSRYSSPPLTATLRIPFRQQSLTDLRDRILGAQFGAPLRFRIPPLDDVTPYLLMAKRLVQPFNQTPYLDIELLEIPTLPKINPRLTITRVTGLHNGWFLTCSWSWPLSDPSDAWTIQIARRGSDDWSALTTDVDFRRQLRPAPGARSIANQYVSTVIANGDWDLRIISGDLESNRAPFSYPFPR